MSKWSKIALLLVVLVLCIANMAFAEIKELRDDFTGARTVASISENIPNNFDSIMVAYLIKTKNQTALSFNASSGKWVFFSDNFNTDIKVDNNIYSIKVAKTKSELRGTLCKTSNFLIIEDNMANIIKNANKITIRTYIRNGDSLVWEVPNKTLNEWKQVLNTQL